MEDHHTVVIVLTAAAAAAVVIMVAAVVEHQTRLPQAVIQEMELAVAVVHHILIQHMLVL